MEDRIILKNSIITPDGTRLVSRYRNDYQAHLDKNGYVYAVDGGLDYLKRRAPREPELNLFQKLFYSIFGIKTNKLSYTENSVFSDDYFEKIRLEFERGSRGVDGDEELRYIPLYLISNDYLKSIIDWEHKHRKDNPTLDVYLMELNYRFEKGIFVNN